MKEVSYKSFTRWAEADAEEDADAGDGREAGAGADATEVRGETRTKVH